AILPSPPTRRFAARGLGMLGIGSGTRRGRGRQSRRALRTRAAAIIIQPVMITKPPTQAAFAGSVAPRRARVAMSEKSQPVAFKFHDEERGEKLLAACFEPDSLVLEMPVPHDGLNQVSVT